MTKSIKLEGTYILKGSKLQGKDLELHFCNRKPAPRKPSVYLIAKLPYEPKPLHISGVYEWSTGKVIEYQKVFYSLTMKEGKATIKRLKP